MRAVALAHRLRQHGTEGDFDSLQRLLTVLDRGLTQSDDYVSDAIAVCFVEDTGWWDSEMAPFMSTWPAGLVAEAEHQRRMSNEGRR